MTLSLFVIRFLAVLYLGVGLGMLLNKSHYRTMMTAFAKDSGARYIGGFFALGVGFALVTYHNIWEKSWVVLVTVVGWLALLKGLTFLLFPGFVDKAVHFWTKESVWPYMNFFILAMGLVCGYFGFIA